MLIVTPYFQPAWGFGGPVRSVWNLARGLVEAGADVAVATTDADPSGFVAVPPHRIEEGVSVHTFPRRFRAVERLKTYYYSPQLKSFLESVIPGSCIAHLQGLYVWPTLVASRICARHGVPYIVAPRGSFGRWGLRQKALKKNVYIRLCEQKTVNLACAIHYTDSSEFEEAPDWVKSLPALVVPNGVEFAPLSTGGGWRRKHGLPESGFVIGMIGRIHPKKGIELILEALAGCNAGKDMHLVIVGRGEEKHERKLREDIRRLGLTERVTVTGLLSGTDVIDAYASIDLLVLPSHEENFGNVVVEALSQNTPVAVSPQVALSSWVAGKSLGVAIPLDVGAWADYLRTLPRARREKTRHLRTVAESRFDYRAVGRKMLEAYLEVAGRKRAPT